MSRTAAAALAPAPLTDGRAITLRAAALLRPEPEPATYCPAKLYLADLTTKASRRTMRSRLTQAAKMLGSTFDDIPWAEIRAEWLLAVKQLMTDEESGHRAHPATTNLTLQAMRGVAAYAFGRGHVDADQLERIRQVGLVEYARVPRGRALAEEELSVLLGAAEAAENEATRLRDLALLSLLAGAGLRRSEAAGLGLDRYDRKRRTLKVDGKGHRQRLLQLGDDGVCRALDDWLDFRGRSGETLLCPVDRWGRVHTDRRLSADAIYKIVRKRADEAGLDPCSPHDMRHTFGSRLFTFLLDSGSDTADVQGLLGHAKEKDTRLYDHRGDESKRRVMEKAPLPFSPRRRRPPRRGRPRHRRTSTTPVKLSKKHMRMGAVAWANSREADAE